MPNSVCQYLNWLYAYHLFPECYPCVESIAITTCSSNTLKAVVVVVCYALKSVRLKFMQCETSVLLCMYIAIC